MQIFFLLRVLITVTLIAMQRGVRGGKGCVRLRTLAGLVVRRSGVKPKGIIGRRSVASIALVWRVRIVIRETKHVDLVSVSNGVRAEEGR